MQSSKSQDRHAKPFGGLLDLLVTAGRYGVRLTAVVLWIGVGGYAWLWPVVALPYTVGLVGLAVGLALIAALLGDRSDASSIAFVSQSRRHRWLDRALLVGCLVGISVGTVGMSSTAGRLPTDLPTLPPVLAGTLVVVSLLCVVGRVYSPSVAGLAVVSIGVAWVAIPGGWTSLVETMAFSSDGIYGPLTRAGAIWIAPGCLLVGLWSATGTLDRLRELFSEAELSTTLTKTTHLEQKARQLTPLSVGFVAVLIAWQTVDTGSLTALSAAAIPAVVLWVGRGGDLTERLSSSPGWTRSWQAWCSLLLMAGGPIVLMVVVLVGFRQPVGTVLVAGCLLVCGLCAVGPLGKGITSVDKNNQTKGHQANTKRQAGIRTGIRPVLDGSVVGVTLLARVLILLGICGGVVSTLQAAGASTWLVSTVLWLSGGQTVLVLVVLASGCVALGMALPMVGGYAVGALLVVPLVRTLTPVPEFPAHLIVWYAVVVGGVLGPEISRQRQTVSRLLASE
jgi:hypothetical protein